MKKTLIIILSFLYISTICLAQDESFDTTKTLGEVVVKAFDQNRRLMETPAAINYISSAQLDRFNNTTILPALNNTPGVRMEERSPGSYRLNIRGSSLRSPFGVRNVKVYYNEIPYTDPGGNTYLNQLGFYNVQSLEIIKGPGSSLYGAGTGGVVLLNSIDNNQQPSASVNFSAGSFNTTNLNLNISTGSENFTNSINYSNLKSDGYRDQSELDRKTFTWDATAQINEKGKLSTHFLYGDLFYETPGALTLSQFKLNPKSARPGAEAAKAAIYQKMFLAGISYTQQFSERWQNTTSLYTASQRLRNPALANYGRTFEPNTGGRTLFQFKSKIKSSLLTLHAGSEIQKGFSSVRIFANSAGNTGALQNDDEINNLVYYIFSQAALELTNGWFITAGASINKQKIEISRLSTNPSTIKKRNYDNELAPRLAVLKKINADLNVYGSISKGFSPPTTAELLPSSGIISTDLEPEHGVNFETGIRGNLLRNKIYYDINAFYYKLKNTIVQRRDVNGADFFSNAGSTNQKGVESQITYYAINNLNGPVTDVKFWINHTWYNFRYKEFKQVNNDFSGNKLPSVPKHAVSIGADLKTKIGIYSNLTYFYNDPIPLNDANIDFAAPYHLLNMRIGFRKKLKKLMVDVFATAENMFNVTYSLGNDINGFGGRYYNTAAGRNYSAGIALQCFYGAKK